MARRRTRQGQSQSQPPLEMQKEEMQKVMELLRGELDAERAKNQRLEQELLAMQKSRARFQEALKSVAEVLTPDLRLELTQPSAPSGDTKAFDEAVGQFEATLR